MNQSKKKRKFVEVIKYMVLSLGILCGAFAIGAFVNIILNASYKNAGSIDHVVGMLEGIIGAIAAGLVLYELKKSSEAEIWQNKIEESTFILNLNQTFIQDKKMSKVEHLLENQTFFDEKVEEIMKAENRQDFVNYLVYLEGLAPLVLEDVLKLDHIDNLMAYRFFVALENVELQEKEIIPYAQYYRGCIQLYDRWKRYRMDSGYECPTDHCKNHSAVRELSSWKEFGRYLSNDNAKCKKKKIAKVRNHEWSRLDGRFVQLRSKDKLDERELKDIAELIYKTDPYIYPALFETIENARSILPQVIEENKDPMFRKDNLCLWLEQEKIVGILLWHRGVMNWTPDQIIKKSKEQGIVLCQDHVEKVCREYVVKQYEGQPEGASVIHVINLCVMEEERGKGYANKLMQAFCRIHNQENMELVVIQDNINAVKLYKKHGFEVAGKPYDGFSLNEKKPRCLVMNREGRKSENEAN